MATLGEMVRRIREDLDRGNDFDARIKRAIESAIKFYKNRRFGFNIKRAYARLTSGNEYVSLPTDWVEADFLQLQRGDDRYPMQEVSYDWIEDQFGPLGERGQPYAYAIQHRSLRLYPIPDRTYTLMLSFQYELKDVSQSASDGATNAWMTEGEELIRKHAMADCLVLYIDGAEAIAKGQLLKRECSDEIAVALESQAAREQSSGRIRAFM